MRYICYEARMVRGAFKNFSLILVYLVLFQTPSSYAVPNPSSSTPIPIDYRDYNSPERLHAKIMEILHNENFFQIKFEVGYSQSNQNGLAGSIAATVVGGGGMIAAWFWKPTNLNPRFIPVATAGIITSIILYVGGQVCALLFSTQVDQLSILPLHRNGETQPIIVSHIPEGESLGYMRYAHSQSSQFNMD